MGEEKKDVNPKEEQAGVDYRILSENLNIIKSNIFRYNPYPYVLGSGGEVSDEPEIKVKKNAQNVITSIEVRCVCGRLIQIEGN
jgi:hypothetical protein